MTLRQQAGVSAERVLRTCLHCKNTPVQLGRAYCDQCFHELLNGDCAAPGCKHEKSALATAPPEQAAQQQPCDCQQLCEKLSNPLPPGRFCMADAAQEKMRAEPPQAGWQPQPASAGALTDSFAQIVKDCREAKVQGPDVKPIKEAFNWIADRIETTIAAHIFRGVEESDLIKCVRCLKMKNTVLVETGFAGECEPLCGQCISKEFAALAAHDQKVRAEICEQGAELIEEMSKRPGAFTWGDVKKAIRSLAPAPAASKPEVASKGTQ